MAIFVDTSALYALLSAADEEHGRASGFFRAADPADLVTHNYILLESMWLLQGRIGATAARDLLTKLIPAIRTRFVDTDTHAAAAATFLSSSNRSVSLIDRVSFETMRRHEIDTAFTFDRDFARAGFKMVP